MRNTPDGQTNQLVSAELERREFQLSLFACSAILILAAGLALLMYPAVFSAREYAPGTTPKIAFFGFCILSGLLLAYIVDRQVTIHKLRNQMALDRERNAEALNQASADLLATMPNYTTFEDRLAMEFRRAAAANLKLSVIVVTLQLCDAFSSPGQSLSALGDAAKAISRKLGQQDSIFNMRSGYFGVILPGADQNAVKRVTGRLSEGLSDAAGANERFSFKINAISYPDQTSTVHDLELVVSGWLPEDVVPQNVAAKTLAVH